ncbi:tRNA pseudouridine(55) synthase TruB [Phorcysia thermohydrogeniphila]|uniref:tRNA pseudouridine(55) synthase TruB n=1 Tax=Phorcysia thermohydrogeniphila TaxID=936138 RepID=UPI0030841A22
MLAIGKATKLSEYLLKKDKCYVVKGRLGLSSNTYDVDGEVKEVPCQKVEEGKLGEVLKNFTGEIEQVPPPFSAIRVKGKRAYELARKGEKVELPPRRVTIYSLKLLEFSYPDFTLEVCCSSGTYIRSLVHDIGRALGCDAVVVELRRTRVGNVSLEDAVPLEKLNRENISHYILPPDSLIDFPEVELGEREARLFKNGGRIRLNLSEGHYKVYSKGTFLGIGVVKSGSLKPEKVLVE